MSAILVNATDLYKADDWRPTYHFSPAAELPRLGKSWSQLADLSVKLLDGWRFSDNPKSDWYLKFVELMDPTNKDPISNDYVKREVNDKEKNVAKQYRVAIEGQRFYRMRHITNMLIKVEAPLMASPAFEDPSICVAPNDVVVRRVGKVAAAFITHSNHCHPVDASIAIIRGLNSQQAIWLTYCLNQPLYKSFLEQQVGIVAMVRVGLKQLEQMPIAPCPEEFLPLADEFQKCYQSLLNAEESLLVLRKSVEKWLEQQISPELLNLFQESDETQTNKLTTKFFSAKDIGEQLTYAATEQSRIARLLGDEANCKTLSELAELNPKNVNGNIDTSDGFPVLKIKHLDGQQSMQSPKPDPNEAGWRVHKRPLNKNDVLVSTFVQEPKVAMSFNNPDLNTLVSEQIAVLKFHHSPGAYSLLMETPLIRKQIAWLSTGTIQRFVQPRLLDQIVMPEIEHETAIHWHNQLMTLLESKEKLSKELEVVYRSMHQVYRQIHPQTFQVEGDEIALQGGEM